ncbi:MAG TPA: HAMP domain-containing sensor histidine kinase [Kofleriaceae bacterium]|nr:HAMP domain-containing sensor histidine kinase [Kofleriaceae bacterium]
MARFAPIIGAFVRFCPHQLPNLGVMQAVVVLTCGDPARRAALEAALAEQGLGATDSFDGSWSLHVIDNAVGVTMRSENEVLARVSVAISPEEVAALARLAQEVMMARAKIRSFDDAESLGLLALMVAHDARNALVPMVVAADALSDLEHARTVELAQVLVDGCRHLTSILRRITTVEQNRRPEVVDVNSMIRNYSATLSAMLAPRVSLVTSLDAAVPTVAIDVADLERMLLNLVANAYEASPEGAEVVVSTASTRKRDGLPLGDWVVITVEDRGRGMDATTRDSASRLFYTTKSPSLGAGLGLSSVARLARSAGGHLLIESEPGSGTKVGIWLPPAER